MFQKRTFLKIISILSSYGINKSRISPHSRLAEDLGLDSIQLINLLMDVEQKFNLTISEEETHQLKDVVSIMQHVKSNAENPPIYHGKAVLSLAVQSSDV